VCLVCVCVSLCVCMCVCGSHYYEHHYIHYCVTGASGLKGELNPMVRENGIFGQFIYKMHYFTKTGSGQT
jgi:hypothetical protein